MTYKENIKAILDCYFTGFREEIIDSACNRILEQKPIFIARSKPLSKSEKDELLKSLKHNSVVIMSDREEMLHIDNEITSILNKIRAEIEQLTIIEGGDDYVRKMAELFSLKMKVLQIIDKYKAESEEVNEDTHRNIK